MNALEFFIGKLSFLPSGVFFCCVSCCSALVNALRAVLSDSVTELSLFRASEMAPVIPCLLPEQTGLLYIKNGKGCPPFFFQL